MTQINNRVDDIRYFLEEADTKFKHLKEDHQNKDLIIYLQYKLKKILNNLDQLER